ncbi:MAG: hypothetical protein JKP96_06700 [Oceanicaulis sp.]|nr:hypothetical protein [Oceanicaulis sp.]
MSAKTNPAIEGKPVNPAGQAFNPDFRSLYVGGYGDVVVTMSGTDVTFKNVPAGFILPVIGSAVTAATTATDIVALY